MLLPLLVLFREALDNIHTRLVLIDNIYYKLPTTLKCIDVCFKAFRILDAMYPSEAEQI